MKSTVELIQESILDVSLDPIVETGIFDATNPEHIFSLIESLEGKGIADNVITEAVAVLRYEGKFPDRQAFNKDGWLVTFPSAEYKQQAIKRHTHFDSDPTHGNGGMNLYYKRKGKQKRMTQQDTSTVEPKQPNEPSVSNIPGKKDVSTAPVSSIPTGDKPAVTSTASDLPKSGNTSPTKNAATDTKPSEQPAPSPVGGDNAVSARINSTPGVSSTTSTSSVLPVVPSVPSVPTPPSFENISIEFAKGKGWTPTPYGEWRNAIGETVAVVGLCGEVVPIKTNDREELKILASKRIPE
jgi:hypothetical protein